MYMHVQCTFITYIYKLKCKTDGPFHDSLTFFKLHICTIMKL